MAESAAPLLANDNVAENSHEMKTMREQGTSNGSTTNDKKRSAASKILDEVKTKEKTNVDTLNWLIKTTNGADVNFYYDGDKRTALHEAARKGESDVVMILLEAGADIKYKDSEGNNALHIAVSSGSEKASEIFKLLLPPRETLQSMKACDILNSVCDKHCRGHIRSGVDCWIENATSTNTEGFNVLDLALKKTPDEATREIIAYIVRETDIACFLRLMRNKRKEDGIFTTPMRNLIKKMPAIAKEVFDRCIQHKSGQLAFHYELLDDLYLLDTWPPTQTDYCKKFYTHDWETLTCKDAHTQGNPCQRLINVFRHEMKDIETCKPYTTKTRTMKNNHPLMIIIKKKLKDTQDDGIYQELLDHPLAEALVKRQWRHIGLKFHVMNLILYFIFLCLITASVVRSTPPYVKSSNTMCNGNETCGVSSTHRNTTENDNWYAGENYCIGVVILASVMLLKKVYQLFIMYSFREYVKKIENYVELGVYVLAVLFVIDLTGDAYTENWHWLFGTFSSFFAWVNLLSYLKKFENLGIYVRMLESIVKTFLKKILFIVAILLVAFTVGFNSIRRSKTEFSGFGHSLLMTASMTITGFEYEAADFFEDLDGHYHIMNVTYVLYTLFLLIMTIIIINLMVGVAVDNVQEIHRQARVYNSISQIEYMLEFDGILCYFINKFESCRCIKLVKKWFVLNPTEEIWMRHLKSSSSGFQPDTVKYIVKLIEKNDQVLKSQTEAAEKKDMMDLRSRMDKNTLELNTVQKELEKLREAVETMTKNSKLIERLLIK